MDNFVGMFHLFVGVFFLFSGLLMNTQNILSFMLFRAVPISVALISIFLFLRDYGFIVRGIG